MKVEKLGYYKHFKGIVYKVKEIALHTETNEKLVVYKNENGDTYARPYDNFIGMITMNNKKIKRFEFIAF